jgi:hypothetical protein
MLDPNMLTQIHEGMDVYDQTGNKIGTVEFVKFGDEMRSTDLDTVTVSPADREAWREDSLVADIAEAFTGRDDIPETLRNRMLRYGYLKIDTGILKSDRYALLDHVTSVTGDSVKLSVKGDELLKL